MDKLYLICVLVFVNFFSVSAQTGLLRGSVHDRDGTPLAAAVVMLMRDSVRVAATMYHLSDSVPGKFLFLC